MAEKKTAKTTPELSLGEQLDAKKAELLTAKKSLFDGTLQNPHAIKNLKKDIARLLTKSNQEKGAK